MRRIIIQSLVIVFVLYCIGCTRSDTEQPDTQAESTTCGNATYPDAATSLYILPFPIGTSYKLRQSNCGSLTHVDELMFSYDFFMDVGETVTAARDGEVVKIKEDGPDGPGENALANYVLIKHSDKTIARYRHLKHQGVIVEVGDIIVAGQDIALSGNSGVPSGTANLHFDVVTPGEDNAYQQTIPITFKNADPPAPTSTGLDEDTTYTALAY